MVRRARQVVSGLSGLLGRKASRAKPVARDRKVTLARRDPRDPRAMQAPSGPLVRLVQKVKPVQQGLQVPKVKLEA